jgi:hypothetical protein
MLPSFQEIVVKDNFPLRMEKLAGAVGHEGRTWSFAPCSLCSSKIFEGVGKLLQN